MSAFGRKNGTAAGKASFGVARPMHAPFGSTAPGQHPAAAESDSQPSTAPESASAAAAPSAPTPPSAPNGAANAEAMQRLSDRMNFRAYRGRP